MKNAKTIMAIIAMASLAACKDAPKADEAMTAAPQEAVQLAANGAGYKVNSQASTIEWIGTKPTGRHHGTFMITDGNIGVSGEDIQSGSFTIDMNSITAMDDDGAANAKLQTHLKSPDFFEVEKYGTSTFEITGVQKGAATDTKDLVMKDATHMVTGNLVMKGVSKSVTFPARIVMADKKLVADANFNIDRTNWGISYKSDKSLGDKVINSDVNIKLHIEAAE